MIMADTLFNLKLKNDLWNFKMKIYARVLLYAIFYAIQFMKIQETLSIQYFTYLFLNMRIFMSIQHINLKTEIMLYFGNSNQIQTDIFY